MKTTIKSIATDVPSAKGNVVLIGLANGTTLVRTEGQFSKDLGKSFLKPRDVKDLIGGTIEGEATYHKAGAKYIADENATAVKEGRAKIGDELAYEKDGYRVDGFMSFTVNAKADMLNRAALASAELMQEIMGFSANLIDDINEKEVVKTPEEAGNIPA